MNDVRHAGTVSNGRSVGEPPVDVDQEPEREHDQRPPTVLDASAAVTLAPGVWVIPDRDRIPHVPNIGIIRGERSALVVESGIGIANGRRVLQAVRELCGQRRLFVTASHFHPEHGYGVQALVDDATIIYNEAQRDELLEKQDLFTKRFSSFTANLAKALEGVEYVPPDIVYSERAELDLGGRIVELHHAGPAHSRGDQVVYLPEEKIIWPGDLIEERFFAIMPDSDTKPSRWIEQLEWMQRLHPNVVVSGHGAIGDAGLIETVRDALVTVRREVRELHEAGRALAEIIAEVEPRELARRPDWGNREWVGRICERFYLELAG